MPNPLINKMIFFNGAATHVPPASGDAAETTAFLARTTGLDATHTNAYKALINGLVADGVFAKLDALYICAAQDLATARLNLVSSSFALVDTSAAPNFTADRPVLAESIPSIRSSTRTLPADTSLIIPLTLWHG
jgi:hypothetical protein